VNEHTSDSGEYLAHLHRKGTLAVDISPVPGRLVYYPPCHLRGQEIGTPCMELLRLIPGISLEPVSRGFYCCGLGGIIGFKKQFHESSLTLGGDLMKKIHEMRPAPVLNNIHNGF
jgi:glycerol-3-phosphate dehydrogenase subunit C